MLIITISLDIQHIIINYNNTDNTFDMVHYAHNMWCNK